MSISLKRICTVLFCVLAVGLQVGTLRAAEPSPYPSNPEIARALDAGNYLQASKKLQAIVGKKPNDVPANFWLARCSLEMGDYERAITYAKRAVNLSPDWSDSHLWLGRAYGLKAEKAHNLFAARKARLEFETAVRLDPNNVLARRNLMQFYLEAPWFLGGSKQEALEQVEAIASRNPVQGYLARADYWKELGKPGLAAENCREVLKLKPRSVEPYFEVADFYESQGNAGQINAVVRAVSIIKPSDPRLDYYRGVERVLAGRELSEAKQDLETYLTRAPKRDNFPPYASAHDWLGRIYEHWGNVQKAIQEYKTALDLSPDNRRAHDGLQRLESN